MLLSFDTSPLSVGVGTDALPTSIVVASLLPLSEGVGADGAGEVDGVVGRLKLYGKSSISATKGGYHLVSTRVNNYKAEGSDAINEEQEGYVAFDFIIRSYITKINSFLEY